MARPPLDRMISCPTPQQHAHTYALRSVTTLPDPDERPPRRRTSMWHLFTKKSKRAVDVPAITALPSPSATTRFGSWDQSGRLSPSPSLASTVQTQTSVRSGSDCLPAPPRVLRSTQSHYTLRSANRPALTLSSWEAAELETTHQVSWVTSTGRRQVGLCD